MCNPVEFVKLFVQKHPRVYAAAKKIWKLREPLLPDYTFIRNLEKLHLVSFFRFYLPRIHIVLRQTLNLLSGTWERQNKTKLVAFGPYDFAFRGWYAKLAHDFRARGRFGYAWDDGLGLALGTRCYNNWATYALLGWLGTRRMCAVGYVLMVLAVAFCAALFLGPAWAVLFGLCTAASPRIITAYTHMGKPEMVWWPLAAFALALLWAGHSVYAAALWSVLAWCNLPCAIGLALYGGVLALASAILHDQFLFFTLALVPGATKMALRLYYMWRSGAMTSIARLQYGLVRFPKWFALPERRQLLFFIVPMLCAAWASHSPLPLVVCVNALLIYWINYRVIYFNDDQVVSLCMLLLPLTACLWAGSAVGLVFVFMRAFPLFCELECTWKYPQIEPYEEFEKTLATNFPCFLPVAEDAPEFQPLRAFFDAIPDNCRIVAEYDADPYASALRPLLDWTEHFLPRRNIDIVSEIYICFHNRELADKLLPSFSPAALSPPDLSAVMQQIGASVFIAFSESSAEALRQAGFTQLSQVDMRACPKAALLLRNPCDMLYALAAPVSASVIDVQPEYRLSGSSLRWQARQGISYVIRYNANSNFIASQGSARLPVEEYRPFPNVNTRFMRITAKTDAEIVLWFRPFPAFFPDRLCECLSKRS